MVHSVQTAQGGLPILCVSVSPLPSAVKNKKRLKNTKRFSKASRIKLNVVLLWVYFSATSLYSLYFHLKGELKNVEEEKTTI